MLNIYVTRHGQDLDNSKGILNGRRDSPLTDVGRKQAEILANKISDFIKLDHIYCSPLERTLETARIIANKQKKIEPVILDALIEREFGVMTGKKLSDIGKLCAPDIINNRKYTYFLNQPGAETFPQLLIRAKRALYLVTKKHKNGNILLVTHGDIGKMLYAAFYNIDWRQALTYFDFGNTELILLNKKTDPQKAKIITSPQYNL